VDVSDVPRFTATLKEVLDRAPDESVLFYLRFFLHSIPEEVQADLLAVIDKVARPDDMFAAEFRTDRDEARTKVYQKHYRRYQNGAAFGTALGQRYGFDVLHEQESTGLAPYREEDPMLYRVIARHR
jgi:hypothetical protein